MSQAAATSPKSSGEARRLFVNQHVQYITGLDTKKDQVEYWFTEHLRISGIYWGLTALYLLKQPGALPRNEVLNFVLDCVKDDGGFAAAPGHDSHMLYTISAVQIIATLGGWQELEERVPDGRKKIGQFVANLQDPITGTFAGDRWGETDSRFLYGAFNVLSLLGLMDMIDVDRAVAFVQSCINIDGAYGQVPGAESHSGQVFTCLGALNIAGRQNLVDNDKVASWLSERQLPNGGLNGRPEKLEDVCYSWWVLSSMAMVDRLHWIEKDRLVQFILGCQDTENGGFSDRPGDMVDVFHTHFGIAGLSLLGYPGLDDIDPAFCMPRTIVEETIARW